MKIVHPAAASIFSDSRRLRLLLTFSPAARTLSQAAEATGQSMSQIFYHTQKFVRLGLLEVVKQEQRDGRPIKYYQTAAPSFFLPAELLDGPPMGRLLSELRESLDRTWLRSEADGLLFTIGDDGSPDVTFLGPPRRQGSAAEIWRTMTLNEVAAKELARELNELFDRFEAKSRGGSEFIVHAAFAPRIG